MAAFAGEPALNRMTLTLAQRLKAETRELHARAERSGVMADLLAGHISRASYVALLVNLHALYGALEAALDGHADDERLRALWHPALRRASALRADLAAFGASCFDGAADAAEYVQRLATAAAAPHRLVAHVYVRCLGDLHGGQMLRALVRERFGLAGGAGTEFYDFGAQDVVSALRQRFRQALSALSLSEAQAADVVAEARWAFEAHCRLFERLQARLA